jgi:hypothetical protein
MAPTTNVRCWMMTGISHRSVRIFLACQLYTIPRVYLLATYGILPSLASAYLTTTAK